jgi:glycosyltransferase involved in cell wall biosynthesis
MARLVPAHRIRPPVPGTRVVIDLRPLQEPERTPITAEYLEHLLGAFTADPIAGESFFVLTRTLRLDPTVELEAQGLPVVARRRLPPTSRIFRSAGLTLDSFLLRGAGLGAARGAREAGAAGTIYHVAGGAVPLASGLPVVATLLDLAPWELPEVYAASAAARFGHRLRARVLHDAARVIVCSRATADSARRRLHLPPERISVVPLAVDETFRAAGRDAAGQAELRQRLGLPERYLVFSGRYEARRDMGTLFRALRGLREAGLTPEPRAGRRVRGRHEEVRPLLVLAAQYETSEDLDTLQRSVTRSGAGELLRVAPPLERLERAALIGGSLGLVYPSLSEATGLPVLEALSLGVPVIASRAGALPEIVGSAGIIVEPRDPARLATAISTLWAGGSLFEQLRRKALRRAAEPPRSWADVARETREVYAAAAADAGRAAEPHLGSDPAEADSDLRR